MSKSTPETELNILRKKDENRKCVNCDIENKFGHQYICEKYNTFVCTNCKSAHQSYSMRVKSLTMSNWTQEEVDKIKSSNGGGNDAGRNKWLGNWNENKMRKPKETDPIEYYKKFIEAVYIKQLFIISESETTTNNNNNSKPITTSNNNNTITSNNNNITSNNNNSNHKDNSIKSIDNRQLSQSMDLLDLNNTCEFKSKSEMQFYSNNTNNTNNINNTYNTIPSINNETNSLFIYTENSIHTYKETNDFLNQQNKQNTINNKTDDWGDFVMQPIQMNSISNTTNTIINNSISSIQSQTIYPNLNSPISTIFGAMDTLSYQNKSPVIDNSSNKTNTNFDTSFGNTPNIFLGTNGIKPVSNSINPIVSKGDISTLLSPEYVSPVPIHMSNSGGIIYNNDINQKKSMSPVNQQKIENKKMTPQMDPFASLLSVKI